MKYEKDFIDLLACGRHSIEYGFRSKPVMGTHSSWMRSKIKSGGITKLDKRAKEVIKELLPELHRIRANIPLTNDTHSRKQMEDLIRKLEEAAK